MFSTQELEARRGLAGKAQALKQPLNRECILRYVSVRPDDTLRTSCQDFKRTPGGAASTNKLSLLKVFGICMSIYHCQ